MHARKTIITCAVTGNLTKPEQHPGLPITPHQIAMSALEAAQAGAAVVHIHVRDPQTGRPSMEIELYRQVIELIRAVDHELIINLTTGPGGRFIPSDDDPKVAAPGTTLLPPEKRVEHIAALKPDICSLDLNTMNSGGDVVINTPKNVRRMASVIREAGVKPELEIFDSGDLHLALDLIYARNFLPRGAAWSAFGIGRTEFPIVAQAWLAGGHVRVGLEDNIYISKGVLAETNAVLVARARDIVLSLGGEIATPREAREQLGLVK
jgi:uncharacterized protein (DUF849 family)